ncbi:MAG: FHA domain-containing protein [Acidimicrobiales bacterium]
MLRTHEADVLREQLALQPGQSAIILTRGPGAGSLLRLGHDVISLGRSSTTTVLLDDISVSRRHAEVRIVPPGYRIVDLGSLNGTYVNDSPVEEALLSHGDDIRIGRFKLCFLTTVPANPKAARLYES